MKKFNDLDACDLDLFTKWFTTEDVPPMTLDEAFTVMVVIFTIKPSFTMLFYCCTPRFLVKITTITVNASYL